MADPGNREPADAPAGDPAKRDDKGRFGPGNVANPSGRPKVLREFREKLHQEFYDESFEVMRRALADPDGKTRVAALKELWDRMFGKAPQAITNEDGSPLRMGLIFLPPTKADDAG